MEEKTLKDVLNAVYTICKNGNDTSTSEISNLIGNISPREIFDIIEEADSRNLIYAVLIEMCCDEDYIIKGITEEGKKFIGK